MIEIIASVTVGATVGVAVGGLLLLRYVNRARCGRDQTDPPGGHSGLVVFTDYETKVQYLSSPIGGMAVRVNEDESPMVAR